MNVVTIAQNIKLQPKDGFINPKDCGIEPIINDNSANEVIESSFKDSSMPPQTFGLIYNYLLAVEMSINSETPLSEIVIKAFYPSITGALQVNQEKRAFFLVKEIVDSYSKKIVDYKKAIVASEELVNYDSEYRRGFYNPNYKATTTLGTDAQLIELLINATKLYLLKNECILKFGLEFSGKGSKNVSAGECDLLCLDSLIDFKATKKAPTKENTFQLLLYYILGCHEYPEAFKKIKYLKIINPKMNNIYTYNISSINKSILQLVELDIIGYEKSVF